MPVRSPGGRPPVRWVCRRSVLLHTALLLVLPLCAIAAWWQIQRALSGNGLSWLYVFEWPAFAVIAVWLWWVLVTGPVAVAAPEPSGGPDRQMALIARRTAPLRWDQSGETAALKEYNAFLGALSAGRPANRPHRVGRGGSR